MNSNSNVNIMELAAAMPNAILQISAGDLCDFANRLIESATDVARLQIERANLSKELLTIEEVADMLKVSKMTLYRWNMNHNRSRYISRKIFQHLCYRLRPAC